MIVIYTKEDLIKVVRELKLKKNIIDII